MVSAFSYVPAVDFSRLKDGQYKPNELLKLKEAIFTVGFLYLTNTGLEVGIHPPGEISDWSNVDGTPDFASPHS